MKITRRTRRDAKRLFRLCVANGLVDDNRVRQVVESLLKSGKSDRLPLLAQFLRRVKFAADLRAATVESATPLAEEFQNKVRDDLTRSYGPGISIAFQHSPELLGGMRIKVGNDVYDGSIRARLAELEARF